MAKHKKRMRRITGVAAKIQRMKSTVEAIVKYILDTVKEEEKLLCPAWIQQIRLPETRTGEKLTPRQFSHALTTEVKRILEGVQVNRCPCVELTI